MPNRLATSTSPYLLQHAANPVEWYPWGEEAIKAAQEQDKPIFLSIGYSTCHLCHIMEKEVFSNPQMAALLNQTFINVKVDREELPEIDALYVEFAQLMMPGGISWPLNLVLSPELCPFFAMGIPIGTHEESGSLSIAMRQLIVQMQALWTSEERDQVLEQAEEVMQVLASNSPVVGAEMPDESILFKAAQHFYKIVDPINGGLKGVPKFPVGYQVSFLLRFAAKEQDSRALFCADLTLDHIHRGGIYDHLGGGVERYAVDEKWKRPHFEKMLFDNALLADAYTQAWQLTKEPTWRECSTFILDFMLREMTLEVEGDIAFLSSEDADSEGKEGLYYTWTLAEVNKVLGEKDAAMFCKYYGITPDGPYQGRCVLAADEKEEEFAAKRSLDVTAFKTYLKMCRQKLSEERKKRAMPVKDDKIIAAWNGYAIAALAVASQAFNDPRYLKSAVMAARFVQKRMWQQERLMRSWCKGVTSHEGCLEDYAAMTRAFLTLFEVEGSSEWLAWALRLESIASSLFKENDGAYYLTDGKDPYVIVRRAYFVDGTEPSGNGLQGENLLKLFHLTEDQKYQSYAEDILRAIKDSIDQYPPGFCYHLMNLLYYYDEKTTTIVVALNKAKEDEEAIRQILFQSFGVHRLIVWKKEEDDGLLEHLPHLQNLKPINGKTTVYVSRGDDIYQPVQDLSLLLKACG